MIKTLLATAISALLATSAFAYSGMDEKTGIEEAILDYVEGFYQASPERLARSVHPELWKRGYGYWNGEYRLRNMTFEQAQELAKTWNQDGKQANADSPREIEIYDILDKTASAKVTAVWGIDYFHLAKIDGKWMIMNVLWQSHPPEE